MAQSDERKFEVGGQLWFLSVPKRTTTVTTNGLNLVADRELVVGFGGRLGYNFSRYIAMEAEVNVVPRDRELEDGRKVQGVFGLKAGKRFEKVGVFVKARPGFIYSSQGNYEELNPVALCGGIYPLPISCYSSVSSTDFALDLGGVVEIYPSKRTVFRFDAGDTLVRHGARNVAAFHTPPLGTPEGGRIVVVPIASETSHNFQMSLGLGFRF